MTTSSGSFVCTPAATVPRLCGTERCRKHLIDTQLDYSSYRTHEDQHEEQQEEEKEEQWMEDHLNTINIIANVALGGGFHSAVRSVKARVCYMRMRITQVAIATEIVPVASLNMCTSALAEIFHQGHAVAV